MSDHFKSQNNKVFYIAEIGGNHEGNFTSAKSMCEQAILSGADAIKFQLYKGDTLVSARADADRNNHFKKFELTKGQHVELAEMVINAGRHYMASVWDEEMLSWIDPYINIHKVGSGDLTNYKMLKSLVVTQKPIIISTGLSSLDDIEKTVAYIQNLDASYISDKKLCLLQCTSVYPTPDEQANLRVIPRLAEKFSLPIGYSDHTIGWDALEISYSFGARVIEKHFTDTRMDKEFRDHKVSLTCEEVKEFLKKLKKIDILLGEADKKPTADEISSNHITSFRRGLYARKNILKGDILSDDNIIALRPYQGICASKYDDVLGKKVIKNITKLSPIAKEDII